MQDEVYMKRALKIAQLGRFTTHPNPNVGCVIVKKNKIIGEGFHYRSGEPHAEINALHIAGKKAKGSTVYVTLEPCSHYGRTPPCCEALVSAGVSRVVSAMQDPNPKVNGQGLDFLKEKGLEVSCGLMIKEAEKLNKGFLKRMRTGLPHVQVKLGASLDGRTAMKNGESKWITSLQSRRDAQCFRAQSHSILTSSETILSDNPLLTIRWNELDSNIQIVYPLKNIRQPLRIVIDSKNRISLNHRIIHQPGETWFARIQKDIQKWPINVQQLLVPENNGYLDLVILMHLLGEKKINSVFVESGPTLVGALLTAGLVDELIIYLAPKLLGNDARSLCILPGIKELSDAINFNFIKIRQIGPDLCLHLLTSKI